MEQPKFTIGQKVKFVNDHDVHAGLVQGFSYDSNSGYSYKISSKTYDIESNSMVEGIKNCREEELVEVKDSSLEKAENAE